MEFKNALRHFTTATLEEMQDDLTAWELDDPWDTSNTRDAREAKKLLSEIKMQLAKIKDM